MMIKQFNADHSQEDSKLRVHVHNITIREDELIFPFLLAWKDNSDLLSSHWEYRKLNTIELIKTTPSSSLGQTYK